MKFLTSSVGIALILGLCACTTTRIEPNSPSVALSGTLRAGLQDPRAELIYNGNTYRGVWREAAATSEQVAQVAYPHRKHLTQIYLDLAASNGKAMTCSGLTHALQGNLTCEVDGKVLAVTLN